MDNTTKFIPLSPQPSISAQNQEAMMPCKMMKRNNWREYCITCSSWSRLGCNIEIAPKYQNNCTITTRTEATRLKFIFAKTKVQP